MPTLIWFPKQISLRRSLFHRRRILLVDGETCDRERYGQYLRARGFKVRACPSYAEGERHLERENYDLVIVDQGGPAFEGKVIVERSLLKDRRVPILVITRHHDLACYIEAIHLGAFDYLEKPITSDDIIWTIETHLAPSRFDAKLAS